MLSGGSDRTTPVELTSGSIFLSVLCVLCG